MPPQRLITTTTQYRTFKKQKSCVPDYQALGHDITYCRPWKVEVFVTDVYSDADDAVDGSPDLSVVFYHRFFGHTNTGGNMISQIRQGFVFNKNPSLDMTKYHEWLAGVQAIAIPADAANRAAQLVHQCPRAKNAVVYVCMFDRSWLNLLGRPECRLHNHENGEFREGCASSTTDVVVATPVMSLDEVVIKKRKRSNTTTRRCVICTDKLKVGSKATQMPCSHVFHGDCILKWLHTSPVCPVCRFELPSS